MGDEGIALERIRRERCWRPHAPSVHPQCSAMPLAQGEYAATRHLEAAIRLACDLARMEAIERIVLYGSVAKGTEHERSDVDLACVIDDVYRSFASPDGDVPWIVASDVEATQDAFRERTGIRPHVVVYYRSEFEKGITLSGKGEPEPLMRHGRIIFDRQDSPPCAVARR